MRNLTSLKNYVLKAFPTTKQFRKWSLPTKWGIASAWWGFILSLYTVLSMYAGTLYERYRQQKYIAVEKELQVLARHGQWGDLSRKLEDNKALLLVRNEGDAYNFYQGNYLLNCPPRFADNANPLLYFNRIVNPESQYFEFVQRNKIACYEKDCPDKRSFALRCEELIVDLDKSGYREPAYFLMKYEIALKSGSAKEMGQSYAQFLSRYPYVKGADFAPFVFYQNEAPSNVNVQCKVLALLYLYNKSLFETSDNKAKAEISSYISRIFKSDNDLKGAAIGFHQFGLGMPKLEILKAGVNGMKVS